MYSTPASPVRGQFLWTASASYSGFGFLSLSLSLSLSNFYMEISLVPRSIPLSRKHLGFGFGGRDPLHPSAFFISLSLHLSLSFYVSLFLSSLSLHSALSLSLSLSLSHFSMEMFFDIKKICSLIIWYTILIGWEALQISMEIRNRILFCQTPAAEFPSDTRIAMWIPYVSRIAIFEFFRGLLQRCFLFYFFSPLSCHTLRTQFDVGDGLSFFQVLDKCEDVWMSGSKFSIKFAVKWFTAICRPRSIKRSVCPHFWRKPTFWRYIVI